MDFGVLQNKSLTEVRIGERVYTRLPSSGSHPWPGFETHSFNAVVSVYVNEHFLFDPLYGQGGKVHQKHKQNGIKTPAELGLITLRFTSLEAL